MKFKELRYQYLQGLRFHFKSLRKEIKLGFKDDIIAEKHYLQGYLNAGIWTKTLTSDEYNRLQDIARKLTNQFKEGKYHDTM